MEWQRAYRRVHSEKEDRVAVAVPIVVNSSDELLVCDEDGDLVWVNLSYTPLRLVGESRPDFARGFQDVHEPHWVRSIYSTGRTTQWHLVKPTLRYPGMWTCTCPSAFRYYPETGLARGKPVEVATERPEDGVIAMCGRP